MSLGKDICKRWLSCSIKASLWAIQWWGFWCNSKVGVHKGWAGVNWPCGHWGIALGHRGSNTLGRSLRLLIKFRKCQKCCKNCICPGGCPIGGSVGPRRSQSTPSSETTTALGIYCLTIEKNRKIKKVELYMKTMKRQEKLKKKRKDSKTATSEASMWLVSLFIESHYCH